MLVSGCSFLSVQKALIGHWICQSSEATNYYISSDKLVKVQKNGTTEEMTYKISEINNNTNNFNY